MLNHVFLLFSLGCDIVTLWDILPETYISTYKNLSYIYIYIYIYIYKNKLRFCSLQAHYFQRDDVALRGFAKFFKKNSEEEREHAEKFMEFQNKRGGRILLQDIKVTIFEIHLFYVKNLMSNSGSRSMHMCKAPLNGSGRGHHVLTDVFVSSTET